MARAAAAAVAERTCIVTRTVADPERLIRFAAGPDGAVVPDLRGDLPGRGVWVTLSRRQVEEAVRRRLFGRGFKAEVTAAPELAELTGRLLRRQALSYLSLANKAGLVSAGYDRVEAALGSGAVRVLIAARDGAPDGRGRLARRLAAAGPEGELVESLESAELDLALGRTNVIHAAVAKGGLAEKFLTAVRRAEAYEAS